MVWLWYACAAALCAGLVPFLAKIGMKKGSAPLAAAIWGVFVTVFAWIMTQITASKVVFYGLAPKTTLFLVLSGLAAGAAWLCFFRSLSTGSAHRVASAEKLVIPLLLVLELILFRDKLSSNEIIAVILLLLGLILIISYGEGKKGGYVWFGFALLSVVFACASELLLRYGGVGINTYSGRFIRCLVALLLVWLVTLATGGTKGMRSISFLDGLFLCASGAALGLSWMFYYWGCIYGPNFNVALIARLDLLVTVILSGIFLREHLGARAVVGLILTILGLWLLLYTTPLLQLIGLG